MAERHERRRRRWVLALILVVAAGAALRIWYASALLHGNRFEDEQYSLRNVRRIYFHHTLRPVSSYYPSPVFNLPQVAVLGVADALHRATGDPAFAPVDDEARFLPVAYLFTRLLQTVWGVASMLLVFLVGRKMFGVRAGLLAALVFTFLPWTIHASGYNKPDALLVAGVLLAFHASLRAVPAPPRTGRYLLAGAAVAVAMSAKLTGGVAAVPLVAVTAVLWREPRRWALLALSGLASAACFVVLNPYWWAYLTFLRGLQRDYAGRTGEPAWVIPARVVELVTSPNQHGLLLGLAALTALGGLAWSAARLPRAGRPLPSEARIQRIMLLSFPVAFTGLYALQTAYFKPNQFLVLTPFTSLALGWGLDRGWRRVAAALPERARRPAGATATALLTAWIAGPGFLYVYRSVVPTTWDAALGFLGRELRPPRARLVLADCWRPPLPLWEGVRRLHRGDSGVEVVADLSLLEARELDLTDGLIVRLDLPGRGGSEFATTRRRRVPPAQASRLAPRAFRLRGPPLLAVAQRRRLLAPARLLELGRCAEEACAAALLPPRDREWESWTFAVWLAPGSLEAGAPPPALQLGSNRLPLVPVSHRGQALLFLSRRVLAPAEPRSLRLLHPNLPAEVANPRAVAVQQYRWLEPGWARQQPPSAPHRIGRRGADQGPMGKGPPEAHDSF